MSLLIAGVLAALAAVAQIGVVPAAFLDPLAGPMLPIALVAGWASVRAPREVAPALIVVAAILGAMSEARVGWYLIALLPVPAIALAFRSTEGRGTVTFARRALCSAIAGMLGAAIYVAILALSTGGLRTLPVEVDAIVHGAAWTAALALLVATALWPLRAQSQGLFA